MYITPAGRSSLEVIRGYQQDLSAEGFDLVFECVDVSCGEGYGAIMPTQERGFTNLYVAKDFIGKVKPESPAGCAGGNFISNSRYALLQRPAESRSLRSLHTTRATYQFIAIKETFSREPACSWCACSPLRASKT